MPSPANGSFEELAMPLFGQIYNFACWLAGDRAAAEDLVQETYLKAWKGFSSYRQGTNFRAWMYRIVRNTYLTSEAGLKATASLDDEEAGLEPGTTETPESILLAAREQEQMVRALEALPVHYREVILLCDLEEMSYQEISQALGIPMGTVMSRLSRARKAMRVLLEATTDHPSDKDLSPGTPTDHPSDKDLSPGTPRADHPSDKDLSPGTPKAEGRRR